MKNRKKGFTILELSICLAVIGILSAMIIPTAVELNEKRKENAGEPNAYINEILGEVQVETQEVDTVPLADKIEFLEEKGIDVSELTVSEIDLLYGIMMEVE